MFVSLNQVAGKSPDNTEPWLILIRSALFKRRKSLPVYHFLSKWSAVPVFLSQKFSLPCLIYFVPLKRSSHESVTFCLRRKVNLAAFTNCQNFQLIDFVRAQDWMKPDSLVLVVLTGASTEDLQMKVKEPSSFRPSSSEMCDMLEKANLENRGFQKEVVRKSSQKPGRTGSDFEVRIMYTKRIPSSLFIYLFFVQYHTFIFYKNLYYQTLLTILTLLRCTTITFLLATPTILM